MLPTIIVRVGIAHELPPCNRITGLKSAETMMIKAHTTEAPGSETEKAGCSRFQAAESRETGYVFTATVSPS